MFEMLNVTLTGKYNITGSIAGETPVQSTGEFSIQSELGARYEFSPSFRNVNGHLSLDYTSFQGFRFLSETFRTSFPGLLEDIDLNPEIEKLIIDSIGTMVFCSPESFCSYNFITEPMLRMFEDHLREVFSVNYFLHLFV